MCKSIGFLLFACLLSIHAQEDFNGSKNYIAVVTEYNPESSVTKNTNFYETIIWEAGDNFRGHIVVFPERTLTVRTKDAVVVPNPEDKVIPHESGTYKKNDPMYRVSKAAAKSRIYTVINVFEMVKCTNDSDCPDRGHYIYDTNVAFDRQGMVIARYRKFNTGNGGQVDKPHKPEYSTFQTDFGVTFGMFTGSDILFKSPAVDLVRYMNITNIVFPSRWPGDYPFLTATQVQDGWSYAMNVNVLASGANDIESGCSGYGIYVARQRKFSAMYEKTGSAFIYGNVPEKVGKTQFVPFRRSEEGLKFTPDPSIPHSRGKDLDSTKGYFKEQICHGKFCCNFSIKYKIAEKDPSRTYRAVAFSGTRPFGQFEKQNVSYCAMVYCPNGNCAKKPEDGPFPLVFKNIKISAEFEKDQTLQFPTTLTWQNKLTKLTTLPYESFSFNTKENGKKAYVSLDLTKSVENLVTFGIYSRKFDN